MSEEGGLVVSCFCGRIAIGLEVTELRNWNPDCPEHGTASVWWNSPEQQAKREANRLELAELSQRAREARQRFREMSTDEEKGEGK